VNDACLYGCCCVFFWGRPSLVTLSLNLISRPQKRGLRDFETRKTIGPVPTHTAFGCGSVSAPGAGVNAQLSPIRPTFFLASGWGEATEANGASCKHGNQGNFCPHQTIQHHCQVPAPVRSIQPLQPPISSGVDVIFVASLRSRITLSAGPEVSAQASYLVHFCIASMQSVDRSDPHLALLGGSVSGEIARHLLRN